MKRVITHREPDLDAIVATWLAVEFLFAGEPCDVGFVPRRLSVAIREAADCVVDVGNAYDPGRCWFDHKPPAFADRNASCATRLIWEHLMARGHDVQHMQPLVTLTHEGDARRQTAAVRASRRDGPHAELARLREVCREDGAVYAGMAAWLRARFHSANSEPLADSSVSTIER